MKVLLTYWYFKLKSIFFKINYIQGTRIPSDYPEYMFTNLNPGKTGKFLSTEEALRELKEYYVDLDLIPGDSVLVVTKKPEEIN